MLAIGIVFLFMFAYWDLRVATRPVIAPRFLKNKSVIFAALIGFFDFVGHRPLPVITTRPSQTSTDVLLSHVHISVFFRVGR